jgi:hypothetical protein
MQLAHLAGDASVPLLAAPAGVGLASFGARMNQGDEIAPRSGFVGLWPEFEYI